VNYFLHYTLYPALAKYKIFYLYLISLLGILLFCFLWLYAVDNHLRKKVLFYETRLLEMQKKEAALLQKRIVIKQLTQQKEDLLLYVNNTSQEMSILWQQGAHILTTRAHAHQLIIDSISITKQGGKDTHRKRIFSLTLQGTVQNIIKFLEDIYETKHLILENFSLRVEANNISKIDCSYAVPKTKTPSTHNKLKG
jgi:hypothetical protein